MNQICFLSGGIPLFDTYWLYTRFGYRLATLNNHFFVMKRTSFHLAIAILGIVSLITAACSDSIFDSTNTVSDSQNPVYSPVAVQFLNANKAASNHPTNVKVKILDPDGMVVTPDGSQVTELLLKDGLMSLALIDILDFNTVESYRFFVSAEAAGFEESFHTIVINRATGVYRPVYMIDVNKLPEGAAVAQAPLVIESAGVVAEALELVAGIPGTNRQARVVIEAGTQLLDASGNPISDNVEIRKVSARILFVEASSEMGSNAFPGGFQVSDAAINGDRLGKPNEFTYFTTFGWSAITIMVNDSIEVEKMDRDIQVMMNIDPGLISDNNNNQVKAGDRIPLWSLDESTGVWNQENILTVQNDPDSIPFAAFGTSHLSVFNFDALNNGCDPIDPVIVQVNNTSGGPLTVYCEMLNPYSGDTDLAPAEPYFHIYEGIETFPDGLSSIEFILAPVNTDMAFAIYENSSDPILLVSSDTFLTCAGDPPVITLGSALPGLCARISVEYQCTQGGTYNFDNVAIWKHESGSTDPYEFAGMIQGGAVVINHGVLADGPYDFQIWYGPTQMPAQVVFKVIKGGDNFQATNGSGYTGLTTTVSTGCINRELSVTYSANPAANFPDC